MAPRRGARRRDRVPDRVRQHHRRVQRGSGRQRRHLRRVLGARCVALAIGSRSPGRLYEIDRSSAGRSGGPSSPAPSSRCSRRGPPPPGDARPVTKGSTLAVAARRSSPSRSSSRSGGGSSVRSTALRPGPLRRRAEGGGVRGAPAGPVDLARVAGIAPRHDGRVRPAFECRRSGSRTGHGDDAVHWLRTVQRQPRFASRS